MKTKNFKKAFKKMYPKEAKKFIDSNNFEVGYMINNTGIYFNDSLKMLLSVNGVYYWLREYKFKEEYLEAKKASIEFYKEHISSTKEYVK